MSIRRKPGAGAFSLTELLVVITIIGILAALLVPVVSGGKADARRTVCISNQRQLFTTLMMYADSDSKQSFGGTEERRKYYPFVDENWLRNYGKLPVNIFFCPATRNGSQATPRKQDGNYFDLLFPAGWAPDISGYSYDSLLWFADMEDAWNGNSHSSQNSRFVEKTLSSIQSYAHSNDAFSMKGMRFGPARIWLLTDNDAVTHADKFWPETNKNHGPAGDNTAFADGHVEWIPRRDYVYQYEASQDNNRTRATQRPRL
ncbi:MAG: type II secretion system protein [Limisphaerales bacterium]